MTEDERKKIIAQMEKEAELRQRITESSAEYLKLLKDIKSLHKNIASVETTYAKQVNKIREARKAMAGLSGTALDDARESLKIEIEKARILKGQVKELKNITAQYTKIAKEVSTLNKSFAMFGDAKKNMITIVNTVKGSYNRFKNWSGLFEIDKSIRIASLSMGVLGKRSDIFRNNLKAAGAQTIDFGIGMKELAELQSSFSQEIGRSVLLNKENLVAMGQIATATGLGAEGAAKMASDMELMGYSAKRTSEFVEQTMNDSTKMGLNASKVIKNMQQNMKLLNKYNFKDGVKGFKKMAETVTKLGIEMNSITGMADKLFDIEGAVEMSAQLQVLGGSWANLADPFHLMYMARNDMAGLTEEIGKAAAGSAKFNAQTGEFEISALELHRLRKVAEQTGVEYETLATAAKNAAKFSRIKSQLKVDYGNKEIQEFIENTATLNEKGEAVLELASGPKLVKDLKKMDTNLIKSMISEKQSLAERAKSSQTFDDRLTNLSNQFKQTLLPLIEALSKGLDGPLTKLSNALRDPKMIQMITTTATKIGEVIGAIGTWIVDNPFKTLLTFGLFEAAKWYSNGVTLGLGFNTVANAGGGGGGSMGRGFSMKRTGKAIKNGYKYGGGIGGAVKAGGKSLFRQGKGALKIAGGLGKGMGKMLLKKIPIIGLLAGLGFGIDRLMDGDWKGALAEVGSGAASMIPGVGTAASVAIDAGLAARDMSSEDADVNDGIIKFNKKDKFMKVNDSTMIAGTNENGNAKLAKTLSTNLSDKEASESLKKIFNQGRISNNNNTSRNEVVKIEFGDIKFGGEIELSSPGSPGLTIDITKDPTFIKKITELIHIEAEKAIQGGKIKG